MKYLCGPEGKEKEIEITLPDGRCKQILYAVSGGADSAILLFILAKMNRDLGTDHTFIPFTVPRPDGGANYSPAIVSWINNTLGTSIAEPTIIGDGDLPHDAVVKTAIKDLMSTDKYDFLYVAENRIPGDELGGLAPIRAKTNKFRRAALPFWDLTKDYSIDLYYRLKVEDLLLLTHSCTEQTKGRCNTCFQCNERAWAFTSLGRSDPGTK